MLEQIFSSVARTKILKFFCIHNEQKYFIRELTRYLKIQLNSARRELTNLEKFGFLQSEVSKGKKYYFTNQKFELLPEIKSLIFKSITLEEMHIADRMSRIPGLKLLIFTGTLTKVDTNTDVLIVGKVNKKTFDKYLKKIADGLEDELRYTFLTKEDYLYRIDITDKFIYDIWAQDKIVVIDKVSKEQQTTLFDEINFKHFRQN